MRVTEDRDSTLYGSLHDLGSTRMGACANRRHRRTMNASKSCFDSTPWESDMWTQPCMGVDWRFGLNPVWESACSTLYYGSLLNPVWELAQPCMGACANRRRRIRMNASNSQTANPIRLSSGPQCPSNQTAGDCGTNANCCKPRCQATSQTANDNGTKPPAPQQLTSHITTLVLSLVDLRPVACHRL